MLSCRRKAVTATVKKLIKKSDVSSKPGPVSAGKITGNNQIEKTPDGGVETSTNNNAISSDERGKLRKFMTNARKRGMEVVPEPKGDLSLCSLLHREETNQSKVLEVCPAQLKMSGWC